MNKQETKYIYSSALFVSAHPIILNTVLGSCVSVCLWDRKKHIGGMNHYMLPFWNGSGLASPKYGNIAIEQLLKKMLSYGSQHENIVTKVFGGARMLQEQSHFFDIGRRNIELAMDMLAQKNLNVFAQSTGGNKGRRIYFNTQTGDVLQKLL